MAHQSQRNLKTRVSRLSRRVNGTERALRGLAQEIGQVMQQNQVQVYTGLGLTDTLISVLERTNPGLTDAIKALAKERAETAQANKAAAKAAEAQPDAAPAEAK